MSELQDNDKPKRDERGRWLPGQCGHVLTEEQQRKGGQVTGADRIRRLFEMFDAKPLTAAEAVRLDAWLLSQSVAELRALTNNEDQPVVVRVRAEALLDEKTKFDATERLYDRAFGKPTLRQEIQTNEAPPVLVRVIDGSKGEQGENNDQ